MQPLSYQAYLQDPSIRQQIDRDVRRMRSEAVHRYLVMPVKALFSREPRMTVTLITRAAA